MGAQIVELNCPGCGARVSIGQSECEYCHKPIVVTTFNSISNLSVPELNKYTNEYKKILKEDPENPSINGSIAMCYLKLKMYEKAEMAFEKAIEDNFDNSEMYFYAALCLLNGKKPFVQTREVIDKIIEYTNAAIQIESRGIYYYFEAYIKQDYFQRKFLKTSPTYQELLELAKTSGVSEADITMVFEILGLEKPTNL